MHEGKNLDDLQEVTNTDLIQFYNWAYKNNLNMKLIKTNYRVFE